MAIRKDLAGAARSRTDRCAAARSPAPAPPPSRSIARRRRGWRSFPGRVLAQVNPGRQRRRRAPAPARRRGSAKTPSCSRRARHGRDGRRGFRRAPGTVFPVGFMARRVYVAPPARPARAIGRCPPALVCAAVGCARAQGPGFRRARRVRASRALSGEAGILRQHLATRSASDAPETSAGDSAPPALRHAARENAQRVAAAPARMLSRREPVARPSGMSVAGVHRRASWRARTASSGAGGRPTAPPSWAGRARRGRHPGRGTGARQYLKRHMRRRQRTGVPDQFAEVGIGALRQEHVKGPAAPAPRAGRGR